MRLPLDPGRIVRARIYALGRDDPRHEGGCDGNGYKLRRSCAHGNHVAGSLCHQDVTYQELPDRIVQIDPHQPEAR